MGNSERIKSRRRKRLIRKRQPTANEVDFVPTTRRTRNQATPAGTRRKRLRPMRVGRPREPQDADPNANRVFLGGRCREPRVDGNGTHTEGTHRTRELHWGRRPTPTIKPGTTQASEASAVVPLEESTNQLKQNDQLLRKHSNKSREGSWSSTLDMTETPDDTHCGVHVSLPDDEFKSEET